eukprot:CAMPEP_0172165806 /NCGR_PEP_ID=MMETSP1050-20130122/8620_1 /TAXON_ID=233186 /ORGANISM="Cryptomonas curvata, Strain CCAP979/52" /LENGTH=39 /DNA_ID= /DNA_START= /DNA_END= /DNA_ORIENTATION=
MTIMPLHNFYGKGHATVRRREESRSAAEPKLVSWVPVNI